MRRSAKEALHLVEPGLLLRAVTRTALVHRAVELAQDVLLGLGQLDRRLHVHMHVEVARISGTHTLDALAAQAERLAGLGAFRHRETGPAAQRRHFDIAAQRRRGERDRHLAVQVVAVALEHRVLLDMHLDVEIARRAAVDARLAVARRTDTHPFVDTGRNLDLERLLRLELALTMALRARLRDELAAAVTLRAGLLHREKALRHTHLAHAVTGRAGFNRRTRLGAIAVAVFAIVPVRHADLRLVAMRGLLQRDLHAVAQVGATVGLRAAATASAAGCLAEDVAEDIAERFREATAAKPAAAESTGHVRVHASVAVLIVSRLLLGVGEHLVGLLDLLEFLLGFLVIRIAVRMVLHRELAISLLDLVVARVLAYPEHFVVVTFCHGGSYLIGPTEPLHARRAISKKAERSVQPRFAPGVRQPSPGVGNGWRRRHHPRRHPPSRLLLVVHFLELGIHDVVVLRLGLLLCAAGCAGTCRRTFTGLGLHVGVDLLAQLLADFGQRIDLGVDLGLVTTAGGIFQVLDRGFDLFLLAGFELVAVLAQRLARRVDQRVGLVAGVGQLTGALVFLGIGFGILHHALDLVFGQTRVRLDRDAVFLAGGLVLGAHMQNAVGVDVERDLDLRRATRCRRNAFQVELAQHLVAGGHLALALVHLDRHGRLIVVSGRENLCVLGRDGRVLVDHLGHHATQRFDAQRQRRHVQQQHVGTVARQHRTLDGGTHGHGFVRVHVLAGFLAEELAHLFLHLRHTGHAADQDHVVNVADLDARILDRGTARFDRAGDQFFHQRFELGARDLQVQVLRTRGIGRDVRQVDLGLLRARQFDLGLFSGFLQALQRQHVLRQIDALFLLELADDVVDDALVEVLATEERVAVGRQHFELLFAIHVGDFDDRDVERAAAEVIHGNLAVALLVLVHAERQRCSGRFVDDALDVQPGDAAGILGCLALRVVEVRRHRDHGFGHRLAQVVLGGLLHLAQHFGRNLRRGQLLVAHANPGVAVVGLDDRVRHQADVLLDFLLFELAADQALHRVQRVTRVGDGLALGRRANQDLAIFHVGDDRRRGACAFGVLDDFRRVAFQNGHAAVGGTEVDTDDLTHSVLSY
ncbi:NAD-specific glutamate dehydrogenase [Cupriavidus sp. HMR-1]|nr:NAD-specific glutamate dehydrogenase [Cupriavidus sp. HMR-1]